LPCLWGANRMSAAEHLVPMAGRWDWIYYKSWLSLVSGLSDDVLHLCAGMALLVIFALLFRRAPWHWLPWLAVFAMEFANETYDVTQTSYVTGEGNIPAAWHDMWMTMLWPTVILLTFRWLGRRAETAAPEPGGTDPATGTET